MPSVTLYSRSSCHLCDEARDVLIAVREELPFELEEILIDDDLSLERAYGLRVPVVLVDGEEAFEVTVDANDLRRILGGKDA